MRKITVEAHKSKFRDFVIRIGRDKRIGATLFLGAMAIHLTTEELEELLKRGKEALELKKENQTK